MFVLRLFGLLLFVHVAVEYAFFPGGTCKGFWHQVCEAMCAQVSKKMAQFLNRA